MSSSHFSEGADNSSSNAGTTAMTVRANIGPFEIKSPPIKKHKVAGHMVPTFRSATRFINVKRRRVTITILQPFQLKIGEVAPESPESLPWDPENEVLNDGDRVLIRYYALSRKPKPGEIEMKSSGDAEDDDDMSVSTVGSYSDAVGSNGKMWRVRRQYRSDDVEITKLNGKIMEVLLGNGNETVARDMRFESITEALRFKDALDCIKVLEKERAGRQIAKFKGASLGKKTSSLSGLLKFGSTGTIDENGEDEDDGEINLLVEVVSATNLPIADIISTDAYVIARMKGKEVHRTDVISNNLSPIWTIKTGSLFLIETTPEEFFASSSGLTFIVKDYDAVGSNEVIGSVNILPEELLTGTGKRLGYDINVVDAFQKKINAEKLPRLHLRFKTASKEDIEFMHTYRAHRKEFGVYADETILALHDPEIKFPRRQEKKGTTKGQGLHRVRPGPDPDRPLKETEWMTTDELNKESLKPSTNWVQASSGDVGKLFLEVIACDKLPAMDGLNPRDKTDAFACIVYQDCIVNTDVISNTLSPRWMPWSHRAFAFNISHPSSDILIGFFDHDPEFSPLQLVARATSTVHDAIGRLVINTENFAPGTTYVLQYTLYNGELEEHRAKSRGTVTLRLRLEYKDIRKAMIKAMQPPVSTTVSVPRSIDFALAHYTTSGLIDDEKYSLDTLSRHISELESYGSIVEHISNAVMEVWLWRGHYTTTILGKCYKLPLHSLTGYVWGLLVTWNWNRFPSFLVFCVGWAMLATNEYMRTHPSRWEKVPSFFQFFDRLMYNSVKPENVPAFFEYDKILTHEKTRMEEKERLKKETKLMAESEQALLLELGQEQVKAEAAEHIGKKDGILTGLDPLRPILYPIQQQLHQAVVALRIGKCIVLWNEAYYSFWLTTACFLLSALIYWVPWSFLLRWFFRIAVGVGLGPWMAIVDQKYFKEPVLSNEERDEKFRQLLQKRNEDHLKSTKNYFQRKETAMKLKGMKDYMFGVHSVRVPRFCEDLFPDVPMPSSYGVAYDSKTAEPIQVKQVKFGQTLKGAMIPQREIQVTSAEKEKDPRKKWQRFLNKKRLEHVPLLGRIQSQSNGH